MHVLAGLWALAGVVADMQELLLGGDEHEHSVHTAGRRGVPKRHACLTSGGRAKVGLYLPEREDDGQDSQARFPHVDAGLTNRRPIGP